MTSLGDEYDLRAGETLQPGPWQPVDLTSVLAGLWEPPKPTVGKRSDGAGLFYPGKSHTVVSETEAGKTWLALSAVLDELAAGNHVVFVDFEDDEGTIVSRLLTLAADVEAVAHRFHYLRPDAQLSGSHIVDFEALLAETRPTLVVCDGVTEGMALHGLDPNNNQDAAIFGAMLTKRITAAGAAAVSLDHVAKSRESRGRYALGAVHKINGLSGAQYLLTNRTPFGIGLTGRSAVMIAKDRLGQLRLNALPASDGLHWYGDLTLTSHSEQFAEVSIEPPREREKPFRPTVLMGKIADLLAEKGPLSQRTILAGVSGKTDNKRDALALLILDGYVSDKTPHQLLKPYQSGTK